MNTESNKRSVTIFGTVHQVQGATKDRRKNIDDPAYLSLLNQFLQGKDFVFEEASQLGPTKTEKVTEQLLGANHYLDIDPHPSDRWAFGIGVTGRRLEIDPHSQLTDFYFQEFEEEQFKRESLWLDKITNTNFTNALLVCGYLHSLSIACRLRFAKFTVETWTYVPYLKLCPGPHSIAS
jgi:hypothetical protein